MLDNDEHLIAQARINPNAFGKIYDQYVDRIYRYAYRLLLDEAWAQDVTAVTFEKALRHIQSYEWQGKSALAWLYRIARNEAISQQRKRKWLTPWKRTITTEMRFTETAVLQDQHRQEIHQALQQLSVKEREVIQLRYFEALTGEEVAEVLDCSTNNAYVRLHRALKKLQIELEAMGVTGEISYEL